MVKENSEAWLISETCLPACLPTHETAYCWDMGAQGVGDELWSESMGLDKVTLEDSSGKSTQSGRYLIGYFQHITYIAFCYCCFNFIMGDSL